MNRGVELRLACVAAATACASAAVCAKDAPAPSVSIDPIIAQSLLAPVEDEFQPTRSFRLDPGIDPAGGQRAKLSVDLGKTTLFAITGRLQRKYVTTGPLERADARLIGQGRDSGKVFGGGVSRTFQGVDLSATYQYSKIRTEQGDTDSIAGGPGRSHSLRATARIRLGR